MTTYRELIESAEESPDYWRNVTAVEFTQEVHRRMSEQNLSRAELARRMGTSKAYVTKVLSGNANFTLSTMIKIAMALRGIVHTHIADRAAIAVWYDVYQKHQPNIVSHSDIDVQENRVSSADKIIDLVAHG